MAEIRSALAGAVPVRRGNSLQMSEITGRGLLQLAGWPGSFDRIGAKVEAVVGCPMPGDTRAAASRGEVTIFRVGPERLWITAPLDRVTASQLAQHFATEEAVATELGHARIVLRIAGPSAPDLLARCVPVDLDLAAFPPGAFAQTPLRQIGVLLHRLGADAFDLYVPRSYALSLWEWLSIA